VKFPIVVGNPLPVATSVAPASFTTPTTAPSSGLTISGSGFVPTSTAYCGHDASRDDIRVVDQPRRRVADRS
jgi:hypothetical protein